MAQKPDKACGTCDGTGKVKGRVCPACRGAKKGYGTKG